MQGWIRKICIRSGGSLAQLVEQLAFNQLVVGSNPTRPTRFNAPGSLTAKGVLLCVEKNHQKTSM